MLTLRLLGQFAAAIDERPLYIRSRPARLLLALLTLSTGLPRSRDELSLWLWPDSPESVGRANLRHTIWQLRSELGPADPVRTDGDRLFIDVDRMSADTLLLRQATAPRAAIDDQLAGARAYQGDLLPGYTDEWIVRERELLRAVFERLMENLLHRLIAADRWAEVEEMAEHWLGYSATAEGAFQAMMLAQARRGDRGRALASFLRCRHALDRLLGVGPSEPTIELARRIAGNSGRQLIDGPIAAITLDLPLSPLDFQSAPVMRTARPQTTGRPQARDAHLTEPHIPHRKISMNDQNPVGSPKVPPYFPHGVALLHNPLFNRGTGFTAAEREAFGIRGLLPPRTLSLETQVTRILENLHRKPNDLEKYVYLLDVEDRNETLFYRVLIDHLEEMMPLVYTPTVGLGCQQYGHIFRRPRGLYISANDQGEIDKVLENWPIQDVRVIVVTDGERILGLGDLGANGMGIPVGKLSLYTACAGIPPMVTLPITLDVGTENEGFLNDPMYVGLPQRRLRGEAYDQFVDEFMQAVRNRFPHALVQFEDFANHNAFRLLQKYRDEYRVFNDDIQGTAAVSLAGLFAALRLIAAEGGPRKPLKDQTLLFLGAGEAGIGIADLCVSAMIEEGLTAEEARGRCWFVDSRGLVVRERTDLADHKLPFAHDHAPVADFLEAVEVLKPTAIIGVSGQPRTFTEPVVRKMAELNDRPIIFALSNPTSKSECTAEEAYSWSAGRAIFASGSPFPPYTMGKKTFYPGQGNNSYIFPGVGLGVVVAAAEHVTDEMFEAAARTLAEQVTEADLAEGRIYPVLSRIRDVSAEIAAAVAEVAYRQGLAAAPEPQDLRAYIKAFMYDPTYRDLI